MINPKMSQLASNQPPCYLGRRPQKDNLCRGFANICNRDSCLVDLSDLHVAEPHRRRLHADGGRHVARSTSTEPVEKDRTGPYFIWCSWRTYSTSIAFRCTAQLVVVVVVAGRLLGNASRD